jgi:hypothetical protein
MPAVGPRRTVLTGRNGDSRHAADWISMANLDRTARRVVTLRFSDIMLLKVSRDRSVPTS